MSNKLILDLTVRLTQAFDKNYDVINMDTVLAVISALEGVTITKEQLETTRLAKHINQLRRRTTSNILAIRAKNLLKRWREMFVNTSSSSASASSGQMQNQAADTGSTNQQQQPPATSAATTATQQQQQQQPQSTVPKQVLLNRSQPSSPSIGGNAQSMAEQFDNSLSSIGVDYSRTGAGAATTATSTAQEETFKFHKNHEIAVGSQSNGAIAGKLNHRNLTNNSAPAPSVNVNTTHAPYDVKHPTSFKNLITGFNPDNNFPQKSRPSMSSSGGKSSLSPDQQSRGTAGGATRNPLIPTGTSSPRTHKSMKRKERNTNSPVVRQIHHDDSNNRTAFENILTLNHEQTSTDRLTTGGAGAGYNHPSRQIPTTTIDLHDSNSSSNFVEVTEIVCSTNANSSNGDRTTTAPTSTKNSSSSNKRLRKDKNLTASSEHVELIAESEHFQPTIDESSRIAFPISGIQEYLSLSNSSMSIFPAGSGASAAAAAGGEGNKTKSKSTNDDNRSAANSLTVERQKKSDGDLSFAGKFKSNSAGGIDVESSSSFYKSGGHKMATTAPVVLSSNLDSCGCDDVVINSNNDLLCVPSLRTETGNGNGSGSGTGFLPFSRNSNESSSNSRISQLDLVDIVNNDSQSMITVDDLRPSSQHPQQKQSSNEKPQDIKFSKDVLTANSSKQQQAQYSSSKEHMKSFTSQTSNQRQSHVNNLSIQSKPSTPSNSEIPIVINNSASSPPPIEEKIPKKRGRKKGSKGIDSVLAQSAGLSSQFLMSPAIGSNKKVKTTRELLIEIQSRKMGSATSSPTLMNWFAASSRPASSCSETSLHSPRTSDANSTNATLSTAARSTPEKNASNNSIAADEVYESDSDTNMSEPSQGRIVKKEITTSNMDGIPMEAAATVTSPIEEQIRNLMAQLPPVDLNKIDWEAYEDVPCTCTLREIPPELPAVEEAAAAAAKTENFDEIEAEIEDDDDGDANDDDDEEPVISVSLPIAPQQNPQNPPISTIQHHSQSAPVSSVTSPVVPPPAATKPTKSIFDLDFDDDNDPLHMFVVEAAASKTKNGIVKDPPKDNNNILVPSQESNVVVESKKQSKSKRASDKLPGEQQQVVTPFQPQQAQQQQQPETIDGNLLNFPTYEVVENPDCEAKKRYEIQTNQITKFHINAFHNCYIPNVNGNWDHSTPTTVTSATTASTAPLAVDDESVKLENDSLYANVVPKYGCLVKERIPKDLSHIKFTNNFKPNFLIKNKKSDKKTPPPPPPPPLPFLGVANIHRRQHFNFHHWHHHRHHRTTDSHTNNQNHQQHQRHHQHNHQHRCHRCHRRHHHHHPSHKKAAEIKNKCKSKHKSKTKSKKKKHKSTINDVAKQKIKQEGNDGNNLCLKTKKTNTENDEFLENIPAAACAMEIDIKTDDEPVKENPLTDLLNDIDSSCQQNKLKSNELKIDIDTTSISSNQIKTSSSDLLLQKAIDNDGGDDGNDFKKKMAAPAITINGNAPHLMNNNNIIKSDDDNFLMNHKKSTTDDIDFAIDEFVAAEEEAEAEDEEEERDEDGELIAATRRRSSSCSNSSLKKNQNSINQKLREHHRLQHMKILQRRKRKHVLTSLTDVFEIDLDESNVVNVDDEHEQQQQQLQQNDDDSKPPIKVPRLIKRIKLVNGNYSEARRRLTNSMTDSSCFDDENDSDCNPNGHHSENDVITEEEDDDEQHHHHHREREEEDYDEDDGDDEDDDADGEGDGDCDEEECSDFHEVVTRDMTSSTTGNNHIVLTIKKTPSKTNSPSSSSVSPAPPQPQQQSSAAKISQQILCDENGDKLSVKNLEIDVDRDVDVDKSSSSGQVKIPSIDLATKSDFFLPETTDLAVYNFQLKKNGDNDHDDNSNGINNLPLIPPPPLPEIDDENVAATNDVEQQEQQQEIVEQQTENVENSKQQTTEKREKQEKHEKKKKNKKLVSTAKLTESIQLTKKHIRRFELKKRLRDGIQHAQKLHRQLFFPYELHTTGNAKILEIQSCTSDCTTDDDSDDESDDGTTDSSECSTSSSSGNGNLKSRFMKKRRRHPHPAGGRMRRGGGGNPPSSSSSSSSSSGSSSSSSCSGSFDSSSSASAFTSWTTSEEDDDCDKKKRKTNKVAAVVKQEEQEASEEQKQEEDEEAKSEDKKPDLDADQQQPEPELPSGNNFLLRSFNHIYVSTEERQRQQRQLRQASSEFLHHELGRQPGYITLSGDESKEDTLAANYPRFYDFNQRFNAYGTTEHQQKESIPIKRDRSRSGSESSSSGSSSSSSSSSPSPTLPASPSPTSPTSLIVDPPIDVEKHQTSSADVIVITVDDDEKETDREPSKVILLSSLDVELESSDEAATAHKNKKNSNNFSCVGSINNGNVNNFNQNNCDGGGSGNGNGGVEQLTNETKTEQKETKDVIIDSGKQTATPVVTTLNINKIEHGHEDEDEEEYLIAQEEYRTGMRRVDEDVVDEDGNNCARTQQFKEWHEVLQLRSYNDELLTVLPYVVIE